MRFIIALLPSNPDIFIKEANKMFAHVSEDYLLSKESLPHITLAQFNLNNSNNELEKIWESIQEKKSTVPQPVFKGIGFTKKENNLWCASLTVSRDFELVRLHRMIVEILKESNLKCITSSDSLYRPHLTLAKIKNLTAINFNDDLLTSRKFILALGEGDDHGQFIKTIYK